MKRLVLSGYYGYGNLGDEAICAAILQQLALRDVQTLVLSADPAATAQAYGCRTLKRTDYRRLSGALADAELFVQGGGSLLQDATSWRSPLFYLMQLVHSSVMGTPFMVLGQGIGPLNRGWVHYLVRETLVHAKALALRDVDSYAWALANLPHDLPVTLTADPVYLLEPADISMELEEGPLADVPHPWTLVAVKGNPNDPRELHAWIEGLNQLGAELGGSLLLCPFFPAMDRPFYSKLALGLTVPYAWAPDGWGPAQVLGLCGACQLVIAGRLHPLIFAANRRVPFAAISYDPKMPAACAEFEVQPIAQRPLIGWRTLVEGCAEAAEDSGWGSRYDLALPGLQRRALANFTVLDQVLAGEVAGSRVVVD